MRDETTIEYQHQADEIANQLEAIAYGELYGDDSGNYHIWRKYGHEDDKSPEDWELVTWPDYLEAEVLEENYLLDSRRRFDSVLLLTGCNGPTVWIDCNFHQVRISWNGGKVYAEINSVACEQINSFYCDLLGMED